ncbi:glycosyltransferase [Candidatus Peregrinibacteria bacterium]|nr:glycosyltransferase [Candidatus Peregrinibacteria bacterium]
MRIGHITTFYKPLWGGQEIYVNNLYHVLQEQGFLQRIYQFDTGVNEPQIIRLAPMKRLRKNIGLGLAFNLSLTSKLNMLQKEDVLIVHYPIHYYPIAWHKNSILLTHGVTWDCNTGWKKIIKKNIDAMAFAASKKFVANDTFYYREMGLNIQPGTGFFSEVSAKKWFIPNCVDVSRFQRIQPDKRLFKMNLILVPRNWNYPRGIHLAVLAFSKFVQRFPDSRLGLVGDTFEFVRKGEKYKHFIKTLITKHNLFDKVIFLGRIPWYEMPKIYSSSQMTLIPSLGVEGTSLSALESMACGTATISTDRAGLLDLPTEHCHADADSLYQKMLAVFENRHEIGQRQREIVTSKFNLTNWKKAWINVIEKD